ncbi:MAG: hypothetical protein FD125_986 [bacterium]|nr:MAG: hypothetical protein FD125_986 [bacterium]
MVGVRPVLAILLSDHAVIGIAGRDQTADRRFGLAVGLGHRIEGTRTTLVRLLIRAAEIRQGDAGGLAGQVDGEQFVLGHDRRDTHAPPSCHRIIRLAPCNAKDI